MTFHLTNGASIIPLVRGAGVTGPIIPWDDALHEGPVPEGLNPAALAERRAEFLAGCGWGSADAIARGLAERDAALENRSGVDEIVLWLEHDLYDQLQLLQILDRLPLDGTPRITAVPDDEYLGLLPASRFPELFAARREVTSAERLAARDAWDAFRSPDPHAIVDALPRVTILRHMGRALTRHLQQFPSVANGLSRTEQQALEAVASGVTRVGDVFVTSHREREGAMFMGDAVFLAHIAQLLRGGNPLLQTTSVLAGNLRPHTQPPSPRATSVPGLTLDDEVALTDTGRRVLGGELDRVRACGIDRWIGGVYLSGNGPVWRWDHVREAIRLI